jgi:hypothetical protein
VTVFQRFHASQCIIPSLSSVLLFKPVCTIQVVVNGLEFRNKITECSRDDSATVSVSYAAKLE